MFKLPSYVPLLLASLSMFLKQRAGEPPVTHHIMELKPKLQTSKKPTPEPENPYAQTLKAGKLMPGMPSLNFPKQEAPVCAIIASCVRALCRNSSSVNTQASVTAWPLRVLTERYHWLARGQQRMPKGKLEA